ncbi:39S ribosomal protein L4, mitochondrial [Venturia canescens]|uniref:39S ribosomal protein L4, mitochondrial n=1 Tax=Venturia canescens TaxID=32260 RepID=UPI001C9CFAF1|nr:39S ribosomal protein L4, mitochondrial [Venturia canescens]
MSLIRNFAIRLPKCSGILSRFSTTTAETSAVESSQPIKPIISTKNYMNENLLYQKRREVWLENLDTVDEKKLGLVTLHPDVFATKPRVDVLWHNIRWQRLYQYVNYTHVKTRAEVRGGGRKPWPQKGLGKARHSSIRSPLWRKGGRAHGPRSPTTYFYMLPFYTRVAGLTSALSVKLAQDDLHIINDLEIPSTERSYLEDLIERRNWGPSVLFVDSEDKMPMNMTIASDEIKHVNLMPVYGLNVYSMLKHDTLVLTERAARLIEDKILYHLNRIDAKKATQRYKLNQH